MARKARAGVAATKMLFVRMTPDEYAAAQRTAKRKGVGMGELVRTWLELADFLRAEPAPPSLADALAAVVARGDADELKAAELAVIAALEEVLRARRLAKWQAIAAEPPASSRRARVNTRNRVGRKARS